MERPQITPGRFAIAAGCIGFAIWIFSSVVTSSFPFVEIEGGSALFRLLLLIPICSSVAGFGVGTLWNRQIEGLFVGIFLFVLADSILMLVLMFGGR